MAASRDLPRRKPTTRRWQYRPPSQCRNALTYWLRYLATEPRDAAHYLTGRAACRLLGRHNPGCDGRNDHPRLKAT